MDNPERYSEMLTSLRMGPPLSGMWPELVFGVVAGEAVLRTGLET